jgi:2-succinyl-6-hydroxy-2,4-cyclohexadiene-1-carboxylate synthase
MRGEHSDLAADRPRPGARKIVSGGQTGADRGALDAAMGLGLAHGGWCPRGRRAEDGAIPARYALEETAATDHAVRTEMNVIDSDATLIVSRGALTGGSALTARLAAAHGKPWLHLDLDALSRPHALERVRAWLDRHAPQVLNVAGPRERQCPGIAADVHALLVAALGHAGPGAPARTPASVALYWFGRASHGRPLVLLHGFTGAPASWQPVLDALPGPLPAVAMALPGHHPSSPVQPGFEANVDAMAGALAAARLDGCHLVGYSLGGRAALGLALRHPHLAATLTVIGAHPGLDDAEERRQRIEGDRAWIDRLRQRGLQDFLAAWEQQPLFATQQRLPAEALAQQQRVRAGHDPEALARSLEQMGLGAMPAYGPRLVELGMPVTWIAGALDAKFVRVAEIAVARLVRAGRTARLVVIPGSGHNVPLEQPGALAALLAALLAAPPAAPSAAPPAAPP